MAFAHGVRLSMVRKMLQPTSVPSAIAAIAAPATPMLATSALLPVAAWLTDMKLRAPGTNDQNEASNITTAGGAVLIRVASIANKTARIAPKKPECAEDMSDSASFWPRTAMAIAAVSQNSEPGGADK